MTSIGQNMGPTAAVESAECAIEVCVRGQWTEVPALRVGQNALIVRGKWLKVAAIHDEQWLEGELQDPEPFLRALKQHQSRGHGADIFTFALNPPADRSTFDYPAESQSLAAIRITTFNNWWEKLPQETRKNVRRAAKRNVAVRVDPFDDRLIAGIVSVNNDSPMRQQKAFYHYGKSFDEVKKDQSSFLDHCDFICAYVGDELVGFLKLVYHAQVASILQLLTKPSHSDKRPANALLAKAVELCESKRISYLVYGQLNYGNKRNSPLREFKLRNGFEEVLAPRFYVPLSSWGSLCIKMGLHRGLIGILPASLITAAIRVRAIGFSLMHLLRRCSSMAERPNRTRQTGCSNPPAGSNLVAE